ncbi:MAG: phosphatidylserine decarboxylase [Oscillospiraceae bacterium]|nr:phosphatidylserine decarboxylase [Oscillospiraceae bacterium]
MKIYDRAAGEYREETEYGGKSLKFLYGTAAGRILLKAFFCRRLYSELNGAFMRSALSRIKIRRFIEKYGIDISGCEKTTFKSFDDFFTRRYNFTTDCSPDELTAPCCGRLTVYTIDDDLALKIKGSVYTLAELTGGGFDLSDYCGGVCFVYRLAVQDCHRYVFCDDGEIIRSEEIKGVLHTVRPISERFRVFAHNHRICTLLRTEHFGDVIQIEVGALQVGKINNRSVKKFFRMEEKGFFSFGGSTIIQLFTKSSVTVDRDIAEHSENGVEVLVKTGERVAGRIKC